LSASSISYIRTKSAVEISVKIILRRVAKLIDDKKDPMKKTTTLVGLIGTDIQGSAAPEFQMTEGHAQGLWYVYRLIDLTRLGLTPDALPDLLTAAERTGYTGLAITHPCKQLVIPHLTELSDDARALGAVNTVLLRDGKRIGHNTDWSGYAEGFRRNMGDVKRDRVVQLGAGGAGAAVAHASLTLGFGELTLFDTDANRAEAGAERLNRDFGPGRAVVGTDLAAAVAAADGLVNCTPIGMDAHPGVPLPAEMLRADLWVSDVIYVPRETQLLRHARELGAHTDNGAGMNIYQGVAQFRLFTGVEPDADRMAASFANIRPL
jgi:shikimate dehydrogenase